MMDERSGMQDMDRMDDADLDGDLERRLRAYAGARLSPDQWTSIRMRAAVIEHGRQSQAAAAARPVPAWRSLLRPLGLVALVAILAIGTGASAAVAAEPGGPLYGARLWVETTVLTITGDGADARAGQMTERIDELDNAISADDGNAADAAANAYGNEVSDAVKAAHDRANLLALRATITRHIAQLQVLNPKNPKAQANLETAIASARAALTEVNAKLAALPAASPAP